MIINKLRIQRKNIGFLIIILGLFFVVLSQREYNLIDEKIDVPVSGFVSRKIDTIPGATVVLSLDQNTDLNIYLVVMILDTENYQRYVFMDDGVNVSGEKYKFPLLGYSHEFKVPSFSSYYIVLDNRSNLVENNTMEKECNLRVNIIQSYYYLPGILASILGIIISIYYNRHKIPEILKIE